MVFGYKENWHSSNSGFYTLCSLEKFTYLFWTSVSSCVKWRSYLPHCAAVKTQCDNTWKHPDHYPGHKRPSTVSPFPPTPLPFPFITYPAQEKWIRNIFSSHPQWFSNVGWLLESPGELGELSFNLSASI